MSRKIEVVILGDESQLSAALGKASAQVNSFAGRMDAAGKKMTSLGGSMTRHLTLPIAVAAGASVKFAVDFQRSMELVHTQAGASQAEVEKMSKAILAMAPAVATGPDELAKALYHIESVGLRGAKALDVLHTAALGAKVGQANLEDTTNALTAAQVAGVKGAENATKSMATLSAIVGTGNMRMGDLAAAMSTGILPAAKTFGVSLVSIGSALDVMTAAGTPAQQSATRLRMTLSLLGAPTSKAKTELHKIGIGALEMADAMRKPGGLINALTILKSHLEGYTKSQQAALLAGAFGGGKSSGTIMTLLNNLDMMRSKYSGITVGVTQYGDAVRKTTETDQFKFEQSLAQLQSSGIKIGATLLPVLVKLAEDVGGVAKAFDGLSSTQQQVVIDSALVVAALGPILTVGGNVAKTIGLASKALGAFTTSSSGAAAAARPIATGLEGVGTAAAGAEVGAVGVGVGLSGLGIAALVATPIIAGVAAGMLLTRDTTDGMSGAMRGAKSAANELGDALLSLKNGTVDLKQSELDRKTAVDASAKAHRKLAQDVRDGLKGTKQYRDDLAAANQAQLDAERAIIHHSDALHQNRINQDAVRAATRKMEASLVDAARAANRLAVEQNHGATRAQIAAAAQAIFKRKTDALAAAEGALADKYKKSDPVEAQKHRRLELLALAAQDLTIKTGQIPTQHEINVYYKKNLATLIDQAHHLAGAINGIQDKTVAVTVKFFQTGQIPSPNLFGGLYPKTAAPPIFPATGGLVTGGIPGMDSVPAMLTPGEVVLNKKQQLSLLHGGSGETHLHVHVEGGTYIGVPDNKVGKALAEVTAPHLARFAARRG